MVTRLLTAAPGDGGERVVAGVVALHGRHCLWSSLPRDDSAAVYRFAAVALVPLLKKPPSALRALARTARARRALLLQGPSPSDCARRASGGGAIMQTSRVTFALSRADIPLALMRTPP